MLFIELLVWHASIFGFFLWIFASPLDSLYLGIFLITVLNASYGVYINSYFAGMPHKDIVLRMLAIPLALILMAIAPWPGIIKYIQDSLAEKECGFYVVNM